MGGGGLSGGRGSRVKEDGCNVRLWIAASRVHSHTPNVTSNGLNLEVGDVLERFPAVIRLLDPELCVIRVINTDVFGR